MGGCVPRVGKVCHGGGRCEGCGREIARKNVLYFIDVGISSSASKEGKSFLSIKV
jgi:hypothetical protein